MLLELPTDLWPSMGLAACDALALRCAHPHLRAHVPFPTVRWVYEAECMELDPAWRDWAAQLELRLVPGGVWRVHFAASHAGQAMEEATFAAWTRTFAREVCHMIVAPLAEEWAAKQPESPPEATVVHLQYNVIERNEDIVLVSEGHETVPSLSHWGEVTFAQDGCGRNRMVLDRPGPVPVLILFLTLGGHYFSVKVPLEGDVREVLTGLHTLYSCSV